MESNNSKEELNQVLQENRRLKAQLNLIKSKKKAGNVVSRWIGRLVTNFFMGKGLKKSFIRLFEEIPEGKVTKVTLADVSAHLVWRITRVGVFALCIGVIPLFILGIQTYILNSQNQLLLYQNRRLDQQINLEEGSRRSSLIFLMSNIMDKIGEELKVPDNKRRVLSDELIGRIVSLSQALRPYRYLENDELIGQPLSPERGQLLISLSNSLLHEETYDKLFTRADFSHADLKNAKFDDAYLEGIKVEYADLKNATFKDADLDYANFSNALMEGAKFEETSMNGIKLTNANLRGSTLSNVKMMDATLKNTDFSDSHISGDFRRSNLDGVSLHNVSIGFLDLEGIEIQDPTMLPYVDTSDVASTFEVTGKTYLNENFAWKKKYIREGDKTDSLFYLVRKKASNLSTMEGCIKKVLEIMKSAKGIKEIERQTKNKKENLQFLIEAHPFGDKNLNILIDSVYRYKLTTEEAEPLYAIAWVVFDPINATIKKETFADTISLSFNRSLLKSFPLDCY